MEVTPDTSSARRTRAKPKTPVKTAARVVKDPIETQSAPVKKPRAPRKSPTAKTAPQVVAPAVAVAEVQDVGTMIATAAYYLAAARNFSPGHELDDWLEAERAVHARLYG